MKAYIPESIIVEGTLRKRRYVITVDRRRLLLSPVPFRLFVILAIQRVSRQNDGWVSGDDLYGQSKDSISKYIYWLRKNIQDENPIFERWRVLEHDHFDRKGHQGEYRLVARPNTIEIIAENVRSFGDCQVTERLEKYLKPIAS